MENSQIVPKRNTPRDLFLHLLAIVTLYWSAISFTGIIWQFINKAFPDNLPYYYDSSIGFIKFSVSALIIVFPIFILVSWYLNKIYRRESQVRESKIRKWLIYLTLFIASLVIIGDLISIINTFLNGDMTARFILKALSVIIVAGIIFGYYLDDVRRETPTKLAKYFAWITSILVIAVIVGAFVVVGSPTTARSANFDQVKVSNLQTIQSQIVNYWQLKEKLPANLESLNNSISGFAVPTDPQTKANYEYFVDDSINLTFELCATFNLKTNRENFTSFAPTDPGNWDHAAGRVCFKRTIDKQLYPPLTKPAI
ncbi:MAG: DUF5671 domain-containing protein [Candidatus Staskawiczbacteria bacterium]|nr:DUF5671 domain-containing protein [Candidatus Staskawiczbacteria bacterium]